jgi:rhodanese-related sulfurtransferase
VGLVQFVIDNIILIAVAFVSGAMLVWPLVRARASGPTLTTLQATQLMNSRNPQVLDLRNAEEFAKGSLPNARNVPVDRLTARLNELKKDKPVLLVCATGTTAGKTASLLRSQGFADVYVLAGGMAAWREAGLPVRT